MYVTFNCSGCSVLLRAPVAAAGRRMRCPACKTVSHVPDAENLMDESLAGFMSEAVEKELDSRHEQSERSLEAAQRAAAEEAKKAAEEAADPTDRYGTPTHDERANLIPRKRPLRPKPAPSKPRPSTKRPAPEPAASSRPERDADDVKFPANILEDKVRPYLVVKAVNNRGVTFAFARRWLRSERFRASMPRRCVFSGERDAEKLLARPVLFRNKIDPAAPPMDEIARSVEVRHVAGHTNHEIIHRMGRLRHTGTPFYHPLPFFVAKGQGTQALQADTRDRRDGGVTCDVTIPHPGVALEWLMRVNGVCGSEYKLLERVLDFHEGVDDAPPPEVSSQDTVMGQRVFIEDDPADPLAKLGPAERDRVNQWCQCKDGEVAVDYFADADLTADDAGASGIVVTDQRLIYKKYHRGGAAGLFTPNARIIVKPRGNEFSLVLVTDDDRQKLISLRAGEVDRLDALLTRLDAMPVTMATSGTKTAK